MMNKKIFHYTSVESLAMILSTGKIRFTRLDNVDDVDEAQTHAGIPFGKYFFVSCWTQVEEDNLAQWKMYGGDMQGVRIELPAYPFRTIQLESKSNLEILGDAFGPLSTAELFGHHYMISPPIFDKEGLFAGAVEYVDDVALHYASAVVKTKDNIGKDKVVINRAYDLSRLKSKIWAFQSEYRFTLLALPMVPPFPPGLPIVPTDDRINYASKAILDGIDPGVSFIDVPIDPAVLDQMVIRTGPLCTDGGKVCVDALRHKFAPNARVEVSPIAGRVRRKS